MNQLYNFPSVAGLIMLLPVAEVKADLFDVERSNDRGGGGGDSSKASHSNSTSYSNSNSNFLPFKINNQVMI